MERTDKFSYSFFEDLGYSSDYDSIDEALEAARADAKNDDEFRDAKTVYIGRVYKYEPYVDAVRVIECVQQDAYDEADEYIGDYLDNVKEEEWRKLEAMLTETFNKWAKETGNEPSFFTVEEIHEYSLEDSEHEH